MCAHPSCFVRMLHEEQFPAVQHRNNGIVSCSKIYFPPSPPPPHQLVLILVDAIVSRFISAFLLP